MDLAVRISDDVWEQMAWSAGLRRFRSSDGSIYEIVVKRGITGRVGDATLTDDSGETWTRTRGELMAPGGGRFSLPSGECLSVLGSDGLEEKLTCYLDGNECRFLPAKAMKLDAFVEHVRRSGTWILGRALFFAALGASLIAQGLASTANLKGSLLVLGVGVGFAVAAVSTARDALDRRKGGGARLAHLVSETPDSIGWLYHQVTKGRRVLFDGGAHAVIVHTLDGGTHALVLPDGALEPALRFLKKRAKNAVVGFSEENRAAFLRRCAERRGERTRGRA
jgi:hypothetical protein